MQETKLYIVDFTEALRTFKRVAGDPQLPTIDIDAVQFAVMDIFMQVDPMAHLKRIAHSMIKDGDLYSRDDYYTDPESDSVLAMTHEEALEQEDANRNHLHAAIMDLGCALYKTVVDMKLITGPERYQVINRPFTHDTFLLKPFRPLA